MPVYVYTSLYPYVLDLRIAYSSIVFHDLNFISLLLGAFSSLTDFVADWR